jgi:hypothetical protein
MQKEIHIRYIGVKGCMDEHCPYFTRKTHYDYSDECRCNHPSIDNYREETLLHETEDYESDYDENNNHITITIPQDCGEEGLFPKFCPLKQIKE